MVLYREGIITTYRDPTTGIVVRAIPTRVESDEVNVMISKPGPRTFYGNELYRKKWPKKALIAVLGRVPVEIAFGLEKTLTINEIEALNRDKEELKKYFTYPLDFSKLGVKNA